MMLPAWLGEIAWKGSVILLVAFVLAAWLRRAPASARHLLWTAALATLLLLPFAILVAPRWSLAVRPLPPDPSAAALVPVHPGGIARQDRAADGTPANEVPRERPALWLVLWMLGASVASLRYAAGTLRLRSILRRAAPARYAGPIAAELAAALGIRRRVKVLETADVPLPLACGILHPVIVLPRGAPEWPETRLRTVLRHELAHIQRHDLAAQALGHAACCLYWFHPLVWMAAHRLRQERERACDDAVLTSGIPADEYAEALVELARGVAAPGRAWTSAPAMAEPWDVESRIRALFDRDRSRRPVRAATALAAGAAALVFLFTMASLTVYAQPDRGAIVGIVHDPSGAVVPFCGVTAKNRDGSNQEVTKANAAGEYRFRAIPAGNYLVEVACPGFAMARLDVPVTAGQAARQDAILQVGSVFERMTISGQKPSSAPSARATAAAPQRIRVGGNVQPVRLLNQTRPQYPPDLQQAGVEGTVLIRAVIAMDGSVLSPQVVNTDVDPRLAQLALDAVKQWRFQAALLNGQPIETTTTLTIDFTLDSEPKR